MDPNAEALLIAGARFAEPVKGLTHGFYKYPARFSPAFVRAAINVFTEPGDTVLDNHVGGGTTVVEAIASGRHAVGIDISSLSEFVTSVKSTVFSEAELEVLTNWATTVANAIDLRKHSIHFGHYADLGYYKHLEHKSRWRLRKAIEQGMGAAIALGEPRLEAFGRCVVLRTAQWALDGRKALPSIGEFRTFLGEAATTMVCGAKALRAASVSNEVPTGALIINRPAAGFEADERLANLRPKLVVTSPPYPGVHVLYHRWQVDGRKESALPFMIAKRLDGSGGAHYTMGDRRAAERYFANIKASMGSAAAVADQSTIILQMVAFGNPQHQLPRYLETMNEIGLEELLLPSLCGQGDGRLWRTVPGRRWYSRQKGDTPGSQEVVLIHRKRGPEARPLHPLSLKEAQVHP
ncbi:DNA methyltransferase [Mesorhizobium sp.]|uniref:DNA methyltransferase n=1 Tax=Mesorhizobium sp. TaxID=1871066 RepID=UPI0025BC45FD|nr:DNA methyltransferase [Mesorhizobium sp.]